MVTAIGLIVAVGLLCMLAIGRGLHAVEGAMDRLAEVEGPLNAAAYEMEVNVNGIGLAVLNHLASGRPEFREWVQDDEGDFRRYHAQYLRLAAGAQEQALAARLGHEFDAFIRLGTALMAQRDTLELRLGAVAAALERIDRLIDQEGPRGTDAALADLEAEAAEIGFRLADYRRAPTAQARAAVLAKLDEFGRALAAPGQPGLDALGAALRQAFTGVRQAVHEALALEDALRGQREAFMQRRTAIDALLDEEVQVLLARGLDAPHREADAAVRHVAGSLQVLLPLFVLAAGAAGALLVHSVLRPLRRLRAGTEAVARGDLGHRTAVAGGVRDEFDDLAVAFDRMVARLRETTVSRDLLERSEQALQGSVAELRRALQERQDLQAALRRSETMAALGVLVAGVAHEVRNPLFGISSTLDAMQARLGERPEVARYLQVLRDPVQRLHRLMAELLDYARPAAEPLAPGRLEEVVAAALEAAAPAAQQRGVTLAPRTGAPARVLLPMARHRLVRALLNLVENAVQHSPPGARVGVEVQATRDGAGRRWLQCSVRDQGEGFREEDLGRLFEPFFSRRHGGTGLGLSIAQRVAQEHGGDVLACNHSQGGALLTLRLPWPPDVPAADQEQNPEG